MNHYAKLATVAVRLVAVGMFLLAVSSLFFVGFGMWGAGMMTGGGDWMGNMHSGWGMGAAGFTVYLVLAVVLYLASRPIGRFVGGGLDE